MERAYFIAIGDKKDGPYSLEDLKKMKLSSSTLIWSDGYTSWKNITEIDELKRIIIANPPPLKHEIIQTLKSDFRNKVYSDFRKEILINIFFGALISIAIFLAFAWYATNNIGLNDYFPVYLSKEDLQEGMGGLFLPYFIIILLCVEITAILYSLYNAIRINELLTFASEKILLIIFLFVSLNIEANNSFLQQQKKQNEDVEIDVSGLIKRVDSVDKAKRESLLSKKYGNKAPEELQKEQKVIDATPGTSMSVSAYGVGESQYDEGITFGTLPYLNDIRARNQLWYKKAGIIFILLVPIIIGLIILIINKMAHIQKLIEIRAKEIFEKQQQV